jgi:hypothetical protein
VWSEPCAGPVAPLFAEAMAQECAIPQTLCFHEAPFAAEQSVAHFWFPLGESVINETLTQSQDTYLFIEFVLALQDAYGNSITSKIFTQAVISHTSLTKLCDSIEVVTSFRDVVQIGFLQGFSPDALPALNLTAMQPTVAGAASPVRVARSLEDALITVVVAGDAAVFDEHTEYGLDVEHMVSLHILDEAAFDLILSLLHNANAYETLRDSAGHYYIHISDQVKQACALTRCAIRTEIKQHSVQHAYAIAQFEAGGVDEWLQKHILGFSEYGAQRAANFTAAVTAQQQINARYRKAFLFNSGYPWATQDGPLGLSSHVIVLTLVRISKSGAADHHRRLLFHLDTDSTATIRTFSFESTISQPNLTINSYVIQEEYTFVSENAANARSTAATALLFLALATTPLSLSAYRR